MITLLKNIIEIIGYVPDYILYAAETVINLFLSAVEAVWVALTSLIPLPEVPAVPSFVTGMNWFFPIGAIISIMTPIVTAYIAFLLVRWIYKYAGQL